MNWRNQRDKYGRIRKGQIWKKYHDGITVVVKQKARGKGWIVEYLNRSGMRGKCHVIEERMIYHYFELLT